jgi:hypothetical protein
MSSPRSQFVKRVLCSLLAVLLTIILLECGLRLVSSKSKAVRVLLSPDTIDPLVPDPVLGVRLNPDVPEYDDAGFRNASVVKSPFLVALGDSQTYGTGVSKEEEAWPQQVTALSGQSAYNMGVPGYGPVQELLLMSRAIKLHPRWVAEAFYSGNDLYDAFNMVYTRNQVVDLKSSDPTVLNAINEKEKEGPLDEAADRLFLAYVGHFNPPVRASGHHQPAPNPVRRFLSEHSRLWGLFRAARRGAATEAATKKTTRTVSQDELWNEKASLAQQSRGLWIPFEKGPVRTILVPQYRLFALNLQDPRIREGLRVSIEALKRMSTIAQGAGLRFLVVLIPTKELVFFDTFGGDTDRRLLPVLELAHEEQEMSAELKNELRLSGISYADMLPPLRESLSAGDSPYSVTSDGHPNAQGNKVIAAAVWRAITATGN